MNKITNHVRGQEKWNYIETQRNKNKTTAKFERIPIKIADKTGNVNIKGKPGAAAKGQELLIFLLRFFFFVNIMGKDKGNKFKISGSWKIALSVKFKRATRRVCAHNEMGKKLSNAWTFISFSSNLIYGTKNENIENSSEIFSLF